VAFIFLMTTGAINGGHTIFVEWFDGMTSALPQTKCMILFESNYINGLMLYYILLLPSPCVPRYNYWIASRKST
jgi:hypothetical protein